MVLCVKLIIVVSIRTDCFAQTMCVNIYDFFLQILSAVRLKKEVESTVVIEFLADLL